MQCFRQFGYIRNGGLAFRHDRLPNSVGLARRRPPSRAMAAFTRSDPARSDRCSQW